MILVIFIKAVVELGVIPYSSFYSDFILFNNYQNNLVGCLLFIDFDVNILFLLQSK